CGNPIRARAIEAGPRGDEAPDTDEQAGSAAGIERPEQGAREPRPELERPERGQCERREGEVAGSVGPREQEHGVPRCMKEQDRDHDRGGIHARQTRHHVHSCGHAQNQRIGREAQRERSGCAHASTRSSSLRSSAGSIAELPNAPTRTPPRRSNTPSVSPLWTESATTIPSFAGRTTKEITPCGPSIVK